MSYYGEIECCFTYCTATIKSHRWAQIRASDHGWFFGRNGDVFCPEHVPDWVAAWRERRKAQG